MRAAIFLLTGVFLLTGCARDVEVSAPYNPMVSIEWLGKTCFRLRAANGLIVVTDPYRPAGGLRLPEPLRADVLLVSHESPEANNVDAIANSPQTLRGGVGVGVNRMSGLVVTGVRTDPKSGNIAYGWRMDGIRFAFLGQPARTVDVAALKRLAPVDVLFMPFGDDGGMTDQERREIIRELQPRMVMAMGSRISAAKTFTGNINVQPLSTRTVLLTRDNLPPFPTISLPVAP